MAGNDQVEIPIVIDVAPHRVTPGVFRFLNQPDLSRDISKVTRRLLAPATRANIVAVPAIRIEAADFFIVNPQIPPLGAFCHGENQSPQTCRAPSGPWRLVRAQPSPCQFWAFAPSRFSAKTYAVHCQQSHDARNRKRKRSSRKGAKLD